MSRRRPVVRLEFAKMPVAGYAAVFAAVIGLALAPAPSQAGGHDVEPRLWIDASAGDGPVVALTLDACSGKVDRRILDGLVANAIPATVFVTHVWLERNAEGLAVMMAHPDLFEIENHGDEHVPSVTDHPLVFGLRSAGTVKAVLKEVDGGAAAILAATGTRPVWFRGATARYSLDALKAIKADGFLVAGYSLNADIGASLPAAKVAKRIERARSGDVIIAHINQPKRPAGAGVMDGVIALRKSGMRFVRLEDVATEGDD